MLHFSRHVLVFFLMLAASILSTNILWDVVTIRNENYFATNIPYDVDALERVLDGRVFGQPFVKEIPAILKRHKINIESGGQKAMLLSFQGALGAGKGLVLRLIASALFKGGLASPFVKIYFGKQEFPARGQTAHYQEKLMRDVKSLVLQNQRALIIFDQVDEIPLGVLDVLKPLLDTGIVDGVDYRKTLFIFTSSAGADELMEKLYDLDLPREQTAMSDFKKILMDSIRNVLDQKVDNKLPFFHLIDHFIPFLPLERKHVQMCAERDFRSRGIDNVQERYLEEVMSQFSYIDFDIQVSYAKSGCRGITNQVSYIIEKRNLSPGTQSQVHRPANEL